MGFISQPKGEFILKINGRETLHFDISLTEHEWVNSEQGVRMHYTVMEANAEDSNGILQLDVPASMIEPRQAVQFAVTASAANSQRWFGVYVIGNKE